ncbi:Uncharacterised protein [Candidatus Burarchaeum australiense]|nr:Uncharacterised protein [Candidatus Burarchaeum australiense]
MKKLDDKIVKYLSRKLDIGENTVRTNIYLLVKNHPHCTKNAVGQIYARSKGLSVLRMLDKEDRTSLPSTFELQEEKVIIKQKARGRRTTVKITEFIRYPSEDPFVKAHVEEINRAYTHNCCTAALVLCRKVIENALIEILRVKYRTEKDRGIQLYFDKNRGRHRDFSEILEVFNKRTADFGPERKLVERIVTVTNKFKDDANDKTHSLYHIVKNRKELEDMQLQNIFDMIKRLEERVSE